MPRKTAQNQFYSQKVQHFVQSQLFDIKRVIESNQAGVVFFFFLVFWFFSWILKKKKGGISNLLKTDIAEGCTMTFAICQKP